MRIFLSILMMYAQVDHTVMFHSSSDPLGKLMHKLRTGELASLVVSALGIPPQASFLFGC